MPLELINAERIQMSPFTTETILGYEVIDCWNVSVERGTTLRLPLKLHVTDNVTTANMTINDCTAPTPSAAVERMADWLERAAKGLRERSASVIPL